MNRRTSLRTRRSAGLTLIELMVALAMLAVLASLALPSLGGAAQRARLKSAAEQLAADLGEARHAAAQRGLPVHLAAQTGEHWCWAVATAPGCGCNAAAQCQLNSVTARDHPGITLAQAQPLTFDERGLSLAPARWRLDAAAGERLQVEVSALGRAHICAPGAPVQGYPAC